MLFLLLGHSHCCAVPTVVLFLPVPCSYYCNFLAVAMLSPFNYLSTRKYMAAARIEECHNTSKQERNNIVVLPMDNANAQRSTLDRDSENEEVPEEEEESSDSEDDVELSLLVSLVTGEAR